MKARIVFLLFLFTVLPLMAQSSKSNIKTNNIAIGKNLKSQKEIFAKEYIFPKRIHEIYVDTITGYISLQLRKLSKNGKILGVKGDFLVFDLENRNVKWSKKIDYSRGNIYQYSQLITQYKGNKITSLNIENGNELWNCKNDLYYVNPTKGIGIGYKYKGLAGNIHTLEGIDLKNGNTLWERELKRDYGWDKKIQLNDSTLLVAAAGLHTINIFKGTGWDFETITGKKDYSETIAKNAIGVALGVLTGTYVTSSGPSVVRDVVSNIIIDSTNCYIASRENISQIDRNNGEINWSTSLPEDLTSKSTIFKNDSLLYLINNGFAYWGNKRIDFGKPFIMGLNTKTGKQFFFKTISDKKDPILDFKRINDTLLVVFKDRLVYYSLKDGSELKSNSFNIEDLGELKFFISSNVYVKENESVFKNLVLDNSFKNCIQTNKGKTLVIDTNFNIENQFEFKDLFFKYGSFRNYIFLSNDDGTIILDSDNHKISNLKVNSNFLIIGEKLFSFINKKLIVLDISDIFN